MRTLGLRRRPEPVPSVDEVLTGADGLRPSAAGKRLGGAGGGADRGKPVADRRGAAGADEAVGLADQHRARADWWTRRRWRTPCGRAGSAGRAWTCSRRSRCRRTARCGTCRTSTSPRTTRRAGRAACTSARRRCFWTTCAGSPRGEPLDGRRGHRARVLRPRPHPRRQAGRPDSGQTIFKPDSSSTVASVGRRKVSGSRRDRRLPRRSPARRPAAGCPPAGS